MSERRLQLRERRQERRSSPRTTGNRGGSQSSTHRSTSYWSSSRNWRLPNGGSAMHRSWESSLVHNQTTGWEESSDSQRTTPYYETWRDRASAYTRSFNNTTNNPSGGRTINIRVPRTRVAGTTTTKPTPTTTGATTSTARTTSTKTDASTTTAKSTIKPTLPAITNSSTPEQTSTTKQSELFNYNTSTEAQHSLPAPTLYIIVGVLSVVVLALVIISLYFGVFR